MPPVHAAVAYHAHVQELATPPRAPFRGVKFKARVGFFGVMFPERPSCFWCRFVNVVDEFFDERFDERCFVDIPDILDTLMLDTRQMSALRRTEPCSRRKRTVFSALFLGV